MASKKRISEPKHQDKPQKPYPDFPLFAHATKRWAKKIRGKLYYFGPWADPMGALQRFQNERDDLFAGRTPNRNKDGLTIGELCNEFLNDRQHRLDAGEIVERTWKEYHRSCATVVSAFGRNRLVEDLQSWEFVQLRKTLSKTRGPVALGNEVSRIRVVFNFAYNAHLVDRPIRYGPTFKRPSLKVLRNERASRPHKRFAQPEIRALLDVAGAQLKAMILLGINCGCGNGDVARIRESAVDLGDAWLDYPRPKSGVARCCALWPETVEAILNALKLRNQPTRDEDKGLIFITKYGKSWYKPTSDNPVSQEFRKLLIETDIYRKGVGFYALRHTFETEAGETGDQVAVNHIMGHAPAAHDMSAVYREGISRQRLTCVTDHVRSWLFATASKSIS